MKTFTITVQSDKDAEQLKHLLREANFKAELVAWEDDEFTSEEITMLEERLEEYRKDPSKGKTLEEVKEFMRTKYGI